MSFKLVTRMQVFYNWLRQFQIDFISLHGGVFIPNCPLKCSFAEQYGKVK